MSRNSALVSEATHPIPHPSLSGRDASTEHRATFERVGQRLCAEVRQFVRVLPVSARGVRGMAEYLGVDRNLCQRVLAAARKDGLEFLLITPGPAQLQQLVEGAAIKGLDAERLVGLRTAIEAFSSLVIEGEAAPGSFRRRVRELLSPTISPTTEQTSAPDPFDLLHRAATQVAGCELDARINVGLMWPRRDLHMGVNVLMIQGHVGYAARPDGMPIVAQFADWVADAAGRPVAEALVNDSGTDSKRVLLREFCSEPTPQLVPSGATDAGEHVLEPRTLPRGAKASVFTAVSTVQDPHPLLDATDRIRSFHAHMRLPSRRFLFDLYLHRSLASACVPGCAVQTWSPNIHINPLADWANVIPGGGGGVRLEILGSGLRQTQSTAWPRHDELVRRAFSIAGRDSSDFIGHRMDVRLPVWGAHYIMAFDYTHAPQLQSVTS
jgi:hypothetical protein